MPFTRLLLLPLIILSAFFYSCAPDDPKQGTWEFELTFEEDEKAFGIMNIQQRANAYQVNLSSFELGNVELADLKLQEHQLQGTFELYNDPFRLEGTFSDSVFQGVVILEEEEEQFTFTARKLDLNGQTWQSPKVDRILSDKDLPEYEGHIDHAGIIQAFDREAYRRGQRTYNSNCINCHGNPELEGSIPLSHKFWAQDFKAGNDPYSMYQTLTKGYGSMPPQPVLTPQEKYDAILFIREHFIRPHNPSQYVHVSPTYLSSLPKGKEKGPASQPYHPWSDMDYGNFFINTYELVDSATGPERYHSPGPAPFADEDYSEANFAYKGIAVKVDEGEGGVSRGKAWMIFDHDLMRVAGAWTGNGFIDWKGILLNDEHETYPRTVGELHFELPVGPAWANPLNGSFRDPRFVARDGRAFGPLPKSWANYKGLYYYEDKVILAYSVGNANILESFGSETKEDDIVFTRILDIGPSSRPLNMRIAPEKAVVAINSQEAQLSVEDGFHVLHIPARTTALVKLFIAKAGTQGLAEFAKSSSPTSLTPYTQGGPAHYPEKLSTDIVTGMEDGWIAVDQLSPPFENPWNCRMKLSGIDFLTDANEAVACATDGDVWLISGLTEAGNTLQWQRIASGLFQPLGIKVMDDQIFVTCRDQLVRLQDLNGDRETDFYESFNHDHQVTDHFHEFAMGLQADEAGNLYYAKSGRHAREALIPQHGTLLKVSKDGSKTETIATGFRAANGVCINPDGSFIVTDQQGFWNPMNRINWVSGKGNFYGNMWGYDPPKDSSRAAMEPPLVWVDMEFDRSPSELLWVDSEKWGPLNKALLSFSYGYGKIQLVLPEKVGSIMQGGVIDIPGVKFMTGVMRGRFNPEDGHLYACGMSAWGTNQMMKGGGLYRLRYNDQPLPLPIALNAFDTGMRLSFDRPLDKETATDVSNFTVECWDLKRTRRYGSDRYNVRKLSIGAAELQHHGREIHLYLPEIEKVDVMTIAYDIKDEAGHVMKGTVQHTIHALKKDPDPRPLTAVIP